MNNFITGISNLVNSLVPYTPLLIAAVLTIIGIAFALPSRKTKEFGKDQLPWILIAAGIILCATSIANDVIKNFTF